MRSLAVFVAALCLASASAAVCTEAEIKAYDLVRYTGPQYCVSVIARFHLCHDDCYSAMQANTKVAPNCSEIGNSQGTLLEFADAWVIRCEQERAKANGSVTYVPRPTLGAPHCTRGEFQRWSEAYDLQTTPAGKCRSDALLENKCSDECLEIVEAAVEASPVCSTDTSGNFTMKEYSKGKLVDCLVARNEDLKRNAILQSGMNATEGLDDIQSPDQVRTTPVVASSAHGLVVTTLVFCVEVTFGRRSGSQCRRKPVGKASMQYCQLQPR